MYKTSNDLKNKFVNILKNYNSIKNKNFFSQDNIKKLIYFTNKKSVQDMSTKIISDISKKLGGPGLDPNLSLDDQLKFMRDTFDYN